MVWCSFHPKWIWFPPSVEIMFCLFDIPEELKKKINNTEKFLIATAIDGYNKLTIEDNQRLHHKFNELVKTAITKEKTKIEMRVKQAAEKKAAEDRSIFARMLG